MKKSTAPHSGLKLLFADDERSLQELMSLELPRMGHTVTVCPDGHTAIAALEQNAYDCILVDLDMPGMNGIEVITRAKQLSPDSEAVVITGKSSLQTAVAALRQGAFDYITKPCRLVELEGVLRRVADKRQLSHKCRALQIQLERAEGPRRLIGDSPSMQQVHTLIARVAPTHSTVLIRGETGTGKELVARAVHDQSLRSALPFVAINCGSLAETLIESELFGHRKGAFTGADEHRVGLFEVADGGTLFLDEVGELPKPLQAKLLRVLESGEIRRLGDNESRHVDVRVISATHRHLEEMVAEDEFREDLMFRINTFEIHLPPLRMRLDDMQQLATHLVRRYLPTATATTPIFSDEVLHMLRAHDWPGNVRELANVMEHASILCDRLPITPAHLPRRFTTPTVGKSSHIRLPGGWTLRDLETHAIQQALDRHQGNKAKAADELAISVKTLYNKLNQLEALDKSA